MSTSNIKSPVAPRMGSINELVDSPVFIIFKNTINCELEQCDAQIASFVGGDDGLGINYYKWIQLPFLPYNRRKLKKQRLLNFIQGKPMNKIEKLNQLRQYKTYKRVIKAGYMVKVKKRYNKNKNYIIPISIQNTIKDKVKPILQDYKIGFRSIYWFADLQKIKILDPFDFLNNAVTLRGWSNYKFFMDAIIVADLVSYNLADTQLLVDLIKLAFIRNSKKGQHRGFLVYLQKLAGLLAMYKFKQAGRRQITDWAIIVQGKFAVTGRTQKYTIQPKKYPLHTLTYIYDYANSFVNTKAGTFSIRIWRFRL
jgi:hypothetical protein